MYIVNTNIVNVLFINYPDLLHPIENLSWHYSLIVLDYPQIIEIILHGIFHQTIFEWQSENLIRTVCTSLMDLSRGLSQSKERQRIRTSEVRLIIILEWT